MSLTPNEIVTMLKLYDYPTAPNPRRVKIFAAEKGIDLEVIRCDIIETLEHKEPDFLNKNPSGQIPVLELKDGRCISESLAICRYLEAIEPEPNLLGKTPFELGHFEERNLKMEFGIWRHIFTSWINGPIVSKTGRFRFMPEAKIASDEDARACYEQIDLELKSQQFVAGNQFSMADITLVIAVDFAATMVDLKPSESLRNLYRWHDEVSSRQSVKNN